MSEEQKEVVVSSETIKAVNDQIAEGDKKVALEVAKEVATATSKSLDDLRKELEATREATRKIAEEQERVRIESELAAEKAKLEESQKARSRAVVPQTPNPVTPTQAVAPVMTKEQGWSEFESLCKSGQFRASVPFK